MATPQAGTSFNTALAKMNGSQALCYIKAVPWGTGVPIFGPSTLCTRHYIYPNKMESRPIHDVLIHSISVWVSLEFLDGLIDREISMGVQKDR